MIGRKFGMLTVISHKSRTEGYNCKCDCGNETVARAYRLKRGLHNSCGCVHFRHEENHPNYKGIGTLSKTHWYYIKYAAKRRNKEFNVSMKDAWELYLKQNKKCVYTNLPIEFGSIYRNIKTTASLDRIDSSKGYTLDNVQWVHVDINFMKFNLDNKRFIELCKLIVENIK